MTHSEDPFINSSSEDLMIARKAEQLLIDQAIEGRDVDDFLSSTQGRIILSRALQEISDAIDVFFTKDASYQPELEQVIEAQKKVWRARDAFLWMIEAVKDGINAEAQLDETGLLEPENY